MTTHPDLRRFAMLRVPELSFGSALTLGLRLNCAKAQGDADQDYYNGAGFAGDGDAIAKDFHQAIANVKDSRLAHR